MRRVQPTRLREHLRTGLWLVPTLAVAASATLAKVLARVDRRIPQEATAWYLFGGQAESARELLSTIASSMMTFTGLVFTITILALQLASSQFSPRVLRTFLRDRVTQLAMGMFIGTFVYAMALLPEVRGQGPDGAQFVPALSLFVAFVLVVLSVGVFVEYIHRMAQSIRAVHIIRRVADETRMHLEKLYPQALEAPRDGVALPGEAPDHELPHDRPPGVLVAVHEDELTRVACDRDLVIALVPRPGDFVPRGAPLFRVWGRAPLQLGVLRDCVEIAEERTPAQDAAFGFRQLVDIAERALSPGMNDPTTAVQALDQLHDLLRTLVHREIPSPARVDVAGRLRLVLPRLDWSAFVHLSFDEIRQYGQGSIQLMRRLRGVLDDLLSIAPGARHAALAEQLELLEAAAARAFATAAERQRAGRGDPQGQGSR